MPRGLKIIAAVLLGIIGLASMGLIWLRDATNRPDYCGQCHAVMGQYYDSWASSDYLARKHATAGVPCQACHSRTIADSVREIVTYARGEYKRYLWQEHLNEECFQCHAHGSNEWLIQSTSDYTIDGELQNPHDPHAGMVGVQDAPYDCSECHTMHGESLGIAYCYTCHHTNALVGCGGKDCHEK